MNSHSKPGFGRPGARLRDVETELRSVEALIWKLRHNRGHWPRKWCRGMLTHYEKREEKLRADISRLKRSDK